MADGPRIVYDIVANAEGGGEVDRLATSLEKLDQAIDPAAAARAQELAAELQRLGAQQAVVARFQELSVATQQAAANLTEADAAVVALRSAIDASGAPTTAQAGRLEKLGAAAQAARNDLASQTAALDASRGKLAALGVDANAAAEAEAALGTATKAIRTELQAFGTSLQGVNARALVDDLKQLGAQQQGIQQLRELGTATDKARDSLTRAEAALQAYNQKLAGIEAPTTAQVNAQQRLTYAIADAQKAFDKQSAELATAGSKLAALGVETGDLAAAEERLRTAAQATVVQIQQLGQQQAAVQRFQELAAATAKASAALEQSVAAVGAFRSSMSSATAPTADEAAELQRLVTAAHAAQVALQGQSDAQAHAAEVARAAGVSLESLAAAQARGRDQAAAAATAAGQVATAYQRVGAAAITSGEQQSAAAAKTVTVLESLRGQFSLLQQVAGLALGGTIVGGLAKELGQVADEYSNLSARIKIATGDGTAFTQSLQGVFAVAQRTGTAVDDVAKLFVKLEQAGQKLGLTNADALRLTETITQATQLSGEAAQSANAAIVQFSQGLAAGVLRGEDLNSVLEQAPRLAQALAAGLGVTTGELKKLGEAGSLTAQQVIGSLQGQSAAVQREFDQLPPTIGRAITSLSNNWTAYVGEVDKATGASATAARAIVALGNNLETIGALLFSAGKAAAAYSAINLARTFLANAVAATAAAEAKAADTAAMVANTAAAQANSVAQAANAVATSAAGAAGVGAAANVGKFAAALSAIKLFSVVGILTNYREIGTAIGEWVAKLQGADKRIKELEAATKADEAAARANAQAKAELAQKTQLAADKALGLTDESRKLVGVFDQARQKGDEVSVALAALSKELTFGDLSGITNGIAALDALAQRGKITGIELHDALSGALKDIDLGVFATNAKAAFDSSEQGARRLKEALDAIATESLRRAGTSLEELTTGFSVGASKAVNDVDVLNTTLQKLGITGNDAARVLAGALDKATEAAGTERAVRAVMDRFTELGKQGQLSGQQVSDGLAKAQEKIDALTPGIQGLAEAARKFGTDVPQLMTGVSKAFADSVADVAALSVELAKAGVTAERSGPMLKAALDQRIAAAQTKEELDLITKALRDMASNGQIAGVDVGNALAAIKARAEAISPALKQAQADAERLGVTLKDNVQGGAEAGVAGAITAYERLKESGKASATELAAAFVSVASEATAAAGGITPEWVKVEAATRAAALAASQYGQTTVSTSQQVQQQLQQQIQLQQQLLQIQQQQTQQQGSPNTPISLSSSFEQANKDARAAQDAKNKADKANPLYSTPIDDSVRVGLEARYRSGQLTAADLAAAQANVAATQANVEAMLSILKNSASAYDPVGIRDTNAALTTAKEILIRVNEKVGQAAGVVAGKAPTPKVAPAPAPAATPAPAPAPTAGPSSVPAVGSTTHKVDISFNGKTSTINTASSDDSVRLAAMLKSLENAARSAGFS